MSSPLFACSKCFSRHPFEELSQGQQLCKECRGSFPVVKCTYCRSEFQQESKISTSSLCKRCESNVLKYGKPSSCGYCNIIAAFIAGKCHRCHDSLRKYGSPKTCHQCKQKCAFEKDKQKKLDGKLLCWLCSLSYKRALVRTKQSDPARHSRVFKNKESSKEQESTKDKYFNHKKPQRPDVTKPFKLSDDHQSSSSTSLYKSSRLSSKRMLKDTSSEDITDHVREITQLKETIAALKKAIASKNTELVFKQGEMTAMKASLFNEENLIKKKMKVLSKVHEDKVEEMQKKINILTSEVMKLRREGIKRKGGAKRADLFSKKDLMISSTSHRSSSHLSLGSRAGALKEEPAGSRSRSYSPISQSPSPFREEDVSRNSPSSSPKNTY